MPEVPKEADLTTVPRSGWCRPRSGRSVRSGRAHYVATGDAAEAFMKLIVTDCEQLARDYESHFRSHGFQVSSPTSP